MKGRYQYSKGNPQGNNSKRDSHYSASADSPLLHRSLLSLRYQRLNTQFYSDTVFATTKSLKGNKCAQVFTAKDFIRVHPMVSKQECAQALQVFAKDVGIPSDLYTDGAAELTGHTSEWHKLCRELRVKTRESEPYTQS